MSLSTKKAKKTELEQLSKDRNGKETKTQVNLINLSQLIW